MCDIKTRTKTGTQINCVCAFGGVPGSGGLNSTVSGGLGRPEKRQGVVITEGGDGAVRHLLSAGVILC